MPNGHASAAGDRGDVMAVRETAKLSGLNPETYLTDISWPHPHTIPTPLVELLPWTWKMNHEAHSLPSPPRVWLPVAQAPASPPAGSTAHAMNADHES
jgi:hypothetical protein